MKALRLPLVLAAVAAGLIALALVAGAVLPERTGPPIEELTVERTVLEPGAITLVLRNSGPDPVTVAQVFVNDVYAQFAGAEEAIERLGTERVAITFPWLDGQPYTVSLLTSTGLVIEHPIAAAVATPPLDPAFFGLMALLGVGVGVVPVLLGMLFLPVLRRAGERVVRVLLAGTVGLLAFLAVDATIEGIELAAASGAAFGGAALVVLGAAAAFLVLTAVDRLLPTGTGTRLSLMIAIGIGLHNLGEGLAIGSAYAIGELALGAGLVVGFALHNTTEGVAVVAPLTRDRASLPVLAGLGLVAGAPAIVGAVIGGAVDNGALTATLLGAGVGAILQVIVQLVPLLRGRDPAVLAGLAAGIGVMYVTSLLVAA